MMEQILELERNIFLWINGTHTPFLDMLLWPFSGVLIWSPVLLVPLYLLWKHKKAAIPEVVSLVLVVIVCSLVSNNVFKPVFCRFRPTAHPLFMDVVTLLNEYKAGGLYGFISGHTTNAFGFAMLSSLLIKNKVYTSLIFLWAVLMGYSRIYLGAHFISDVIGGLIIGILLGGGVYYVYKYMSKRYISTIHERISYK